MMDWISDVGSSYRAARSRPAVLRQPARPLAGRAPGSRLTAHSPRRTRVPGVIRNPYNGGPSPYRGSSLAKPNYSFEKRQREIAKKKKQDLKDARKREAREAAKATTSDDDTPAGKTDAD